MPDTAQDVDLEKLSFFDKDVNDCPYHAYKKMRDEAPVWKDPITGMFQVTRYEDIRTVLLDPKTFTNRLGSNMISGDAVLPDDPEEAKALLETIAVDKEIQELYEKEGWMPVNGLSGIDNPEHRQRRALFEAAFKPKRVAELDPYCEKLANELIDEFVDRGRCDFVKEFADPLPLYVIGRQMGVAEDDLPKIKAWTNAWIQRMGLNQTAAERVWSAEQEIEFQNYFAPIIANIRENPDGTLFSDLVNNEVPGAGRPMTDNELYSELMTDMFVGGAETTTNGIGKGLLLAIRQPQAWQRVVDDPDTYLDNWVEEILRVDAPVHVLLREVATDTEMHGVELPAGSVLAIRFGSGNRDPRRYGEQSDQIDLDREQPRTHLAFGVGVHHCIGAPLARREMYFSFKAVAERLGDIRLVEGANDFAMHPNYFVNGLKELHIEFTPRS
jgi:cytochrome P450